MSDIANESFDEYKKVSGSVLVSSGWFEAELKRVYLDGYRAGMADVIKQAKEISVLSEASKKIEVQSEDVVKP